MADLTGPLANEDKAVKGFKLLRQEEGVVTIAKAGKRAVLINHGSKDVDFPSKGNTVKPASQELLKAVYDTDSSYTQLIEAPKDYKAPWEKAQ